MGADRAGIPTHCHHLQRRRSYGFEVHVRQQQPAARRYFSHWSNLQRHMESQQPWRHCRFHHLLASRGIEYPAVHRNQLRRSATHRSWSRRHQQCRSYLCAPSGHGDYHSNAASVRLAEYGAHLAVDRWHHGIRTQRHSDPRRFHQPRWIGESEFCWNNQLHTGRCEHRHHQQHQLNRLGHQRTSDSEPARFNRRQRDGLFGQLGGRIFLHLPAQEHRACDQRQQRPLGGQARRATEHWRCHH